MRSELLRAAVLVASGLSAGAALADSMSVPVVSLAEGPAGVYVLEAQMAAPLVPGARPPVPPARCSVGPPTREAVERMVWLRFAIDCANDPLSRNDVIVLPWAVDGIDLTASWSDNRVERALFGREPVGVVVRLDRFLLREPTLSEMAVEHGLFGLWHALGSPSHWLFALALAFVAGSTRRAFGALAGWLGGHAMALILAEHVVGNVALAPADAVLAGAAALIFAASLRGELALGGLVVASSWLGALHGLGVASQLTSPARLPAELLLSNTGVDLGNALLLMLGVAGLRSLTAYAARPRGIAVGVLGASAMFVVFQTMRMDFVVATAEVDEPGQLNLDIFGSVESDRVPATPNAASSDQLDAEGRLAAPFMSYVVVEPYQIRHEVLVRVQSVRAPIEVIDTDATGVIPLERQEAIINRLTDSILEEVRFRIDGTPARAASVTAGFVALSADGARLREQPVPEMAVRAAVGVTIVYETAGMADAFELTWNLFPDDAPTVPLTVTDPSSVARSALSPDMRRFAWRNQLETVGLPELEAVPAAHAWPLVSMALVVAAFAAVAVKRKQAVAASCLVVAYALYPFARVEASLPWIGEPRIDDGAAPELIERLLTNVYRSFDLHNEELIYDRLAKSVTGEQLVEIYLESRRALELEQRGGARIRIDDVIVRDVQAIRATEDGSHAVDVAWTVGGSVNHFGHVHFRQNRYEATITLAAIDGSWKIRSMELLQQRREL